MPGCLLPAAMAAGLTSPAQWGLPTPGHMHGRPAQSFTRGVYGTPLTYREDTEHFSVQWETPAMPMEIVDQVAYDMEAAWDVLVDVEDWDAPTSSEDYLITVILDPDLGGTGLTYTEFDSDYPAGVPVIYINPDWAHDADFMASLCAHELAHALQFAVRDWYSMGETESWYWEASAEWQAEIARPEMDTYSWSSQYYAAAPHVDHHSMVGYHQYGMFLINAYLDEYVLGADGFRDIWLGNSGLDWFEEIGDAVGVPPAHVWAGFSAAYVSGQLRESALYNTPLTVDGTTALEGWLGTHYIPLGNATGQLNLDGGVGAVVRGDTWEVFEGSAEIPVGVGEAWLAVVNPEPVPLRYSYSLGALADPGDTGTPDDDDSEGALAGLGGMSSESEKGCACSAAGGGAGAWLVWPLIVWRRRAARR